MTRWRNEEKAREKGKDEVRAGITVRSIELPRCMDAPLHFDSHFEVGGVEGKDPVKHFGKIREEQSLVDRTDEHITSECLQEDTNT